MSEIPVRTGTDHLGRVELTIPVEIRSLRLAAWGYRSRVIDPAVNPQRLVMQRLLRIGLEPFELSLLPPPPDCLKLRLAPLDSIPPFSMDHPLVVHPNRQLLYLLDSPGRYRAEWFVARRLARESRWVEVPVQGTQEIAIEESTAGSVLQLAPSANALESARRTLDSLTQR